MIVVKKIVNKVRTLYWSKRFGSIQGSILLGKDITFQHPECIHFGKNIGVGKYSYFLPCTEYEGVKYNPIIKIGDGTVIGIRNSFACIDRVEIGRNVLFAGYVHITDHSHGYEDISLPIKRQKLISKGPVIIEDDCWLGFESEILSGVHIGKHSIVAARAVVTKDVPPYSIVAGNPARIIKQFNTNSNSWERVR